MIHLKKYWMHILIWVVMLVYLVTAPAMYARLFLRVGKPVLLVQELPVSTEEGLISADRLDPITLDGQKLYKLWGWAFIKGEVDESIYERYIVLQSSTKTYFFSTETTGRPDVQSAFADLDKNVMNSGFNTYIAKEVVQQGTYRIGILFKNGYPADTYYIETNKEIVKTANQLKLSIP